MKAFLLVLSLLAFSATVKAAVDPDHSWVALFFTEKTQAAFLNRFLEHSSDSSSLVTQGSHLTVEYMPADMDKYTPYFGVRHTLIPKAYAHDNHGQAVLTRVEGPIRSKNAYPHVSVSVAQTNDSAQYGAVYSNSLWKRVHLSTPIDDVRDADGNVKEVSLPAGSIYKGSLPEVKLGDLVYEKSPVVLRELSGIQFEAIFCWNKYWNGNSCDVPKTQTWI